MTLLHERMVLVTPIHSVLKPLEVVLSKLIGEN